MKHVIHVLAAMLACTGYASAQDFPTRPIRLVAPTSPGAGSDIMARIMAPEMAKALGQPVVVENKPGVGGMIGYEYVAKQLPADGYTLVAITTSGLASLPVTVKEVRFDPLKDLPPVIGLAEQRLLLLSSNKVPAQTLGELVALAKAAPGKLNFGASGAILRLQTEAIVRELGINVTHIPYSGGGPYSTALGAGEVQMGLLGESSALPLVDKTRVLAATGERRRAPYLNVPTFAELGLMGIPDVRYSLNVREGTPKPAFAKLYAAAAQALQQPEVKAVFTKIQAEIVAEPPEVAAKKLASEAAYFADIAKKIGFKPE